MHNPVKGVRTACVQCGERDEDAFSSRSICTEKPPAGIRFASGPIIRGPEDEPRYKRGSRIGEFSRLIRARMKDGSKSVNERASSLIKDDPARSLGSNNEAISNSFRDTRGYIGSTRVIHRALPASTHPLSPLRRSSSSSSYLSRFASPRLPMSTTYETKFSEPGCVSDPLPKNPRGKHHRTDFSLLLLLSRIFFSRQWRREEGAQKAGSRRARSRGPATLPALGPRGNVATHTGRAAAASQEERKTFKSGEVDVDPYYTPFVKGLCWALEDDAFLC